LNPKIEVIKGKMVTENDFEKFRYKIKQFVEAHKVVNASTAIGSNTAGVGIIVATILYE
jgi:hypothetical protein